MGIEWGSIAGDEHVRCGQLIAKEMGKRFEADAEVERLKAELAKARRAIKLAYQEGWEDAFGATRGVDPDEELVEEYWEISLAREGK